MCIFRCCLAEGGKDLYDTKMWKKSNTIEMNQEYHLLIPFYPSAVCEHTCVRAHIHTHVHTQIVSILMVGTSPWHMTSVL